jgi:toxin ParE1/3/4
VRAVRFRPKAAKEIEKAFDWYEAQRAQLGLEFLTALDETIEGIRAFPGRWPMHRRNTRRALVKRFPYLLFYRVEHDVILIVACVHLRRTPDRWP